MVPGGGPVVEGGGVVEEVGYQVVVGWIFGGFCEAAEGLGEVGVVGRP